MSVHMESGIAAGRPAGETLAWGRAAVDSRLRAAVGQLPESMRRIAGYHFGWWDGGGKPINGDSGKAVRPALVLLCSQAVGGDPEMAVPAAVAVELVHNFSLLHDDVMDGDPMRRHRPAAWTVFGIADAILAGDALLALASQCLAEGGLACGASGMLLLSRCVADLCHGQSLDISFEQRHGIRMDECWAMAEAKTGALLRCACSLGALVGGAKAEQADLLGDFGSHLGLAFQLIDDVLGIWGDPAVTGKPAHSDLISRKKSLPVAAALNSRTGPGYELAALYQHPQPWRPGELAHAADLVELAGAREWADRRATREMTLATESLVAADCQPEAAAALRALARQLTARDH